MLCSLQMFFSSANGTEGTNGRQLRDGRYFKETKSFEGWSSLIILKVGSLVIFTRGSLKLLQTSPQY